jgi:c-Rel proto-oncogene protein
MFANDTIVMAPPSNHSPINGVPSNMPSSSNHQQQQQQDTPYVAILEQPATKALRFRYECEGRAAGSVPGVNSTTDNKTYPTIQIMNYVGRAVVVVSCVTKDFPYK